MDLDTRSTAAILWSPEPFREQPSLGAFAHRDPLVETLAQFRMLGRHNRSLDRVPGLLIGAASSKR
ncbi:hypothetical protein [Sphingomonas natans]|uniref:hypothetical protein n=1 Tax=Sphingomonas natans TaxID=3063330 RepID=UPI0026E19B96|nr:hypothetical protein [Sphingomonas sp. BIUV-7]